jgi:hypothetical protein
LEHADGDYQAVNLVRVYDNTFQPGQRAALDVHLSSDAEKGPWLRGKTGTEDGTNCLDLFDVNGDGGLAGAEDADNTGRGEDGHETVTHVKSAE